MGKIFVRYEQDMDKCVRFCMGRVKIWVRYE